MRQQLVYPFAHLRCSLVGEGDCKYRIRRHAPLLDEVRDAMGDDARLPRPGSRKNEHRTVNRLNSKPLLGIQFIE